MTNLKCRIPFAFRPGACAFLCILLAFAGLAGRAVAHEGESHDDKPAGFAASLSPRMVASSDQLELVAVAGRGELTVYIDDVSNNKPVAGAKVELEADGGAAVAQETEQGVYRIKAEWLSKAGAHDLVFTITSDTVNDLLIGTFDVPGKETNGTAAATGGPVAQFFGNNVQWLGNGAWLLLGIAATLLLTAGRRSVSIIGAALAITSLSAITVFAFFPGLGEAGSPGRSAAAGPSSLGINVEQPKRLPSGNLFVPKVTQRLISLRTARARLIETTATVRLVGRIIPDPNASGLVQPSVSGIIEPTKSGIPYLGQVVKRGQVLAHVRPIIGIAERVEIEDQLGDLHQQIELVSLRLRRLSTLRGTVAQRKIDEARTELKELIKRHSSIAPTLARREALRASADGTIARVNAAAGQIVEAKDIVFEIVDPSRLWVSAIAFDSAGLDDISSASAVTNDGEILKLSFVGRGPTLIEQAIPLQFRIDGMSHSQSIGKPVTVLIQNREVRRGLVLPKLAVVRAANGQSVAWEHKEAELFVRHPVIFEQRDGRTVLVLSGLDPDLRIVGRGAELLNQIR